jgi:small subunit ribosomal protein S6
MAANTYECMFLLDPNKVSGDVATAAQQLHTVLERHQAEILASRQWDDRRLAYSIKGHKKGLYYLTYFRSEGKNLIQIERDFALMEVILRMMVLKVDPKLQEHMLAVARDEHALSLQSVPEEQWTLRRVTGAKGIAAPDAAGARRMTRRGEIRPFFECTTMTGLAAR